MTPHERILADTAESRLLEHLARCLPHSRRATGCVVTDAASAPVLGTAIAAAATDAGASAPPVVDVAELATRLGSRRPPPVVVVASLEDEDALMAEVRRACPDHDPATVHRLWGDLYVNKIARLRSDDKPSPRRFFDRVDDEEVLAGLGSVRPYAMVCTPRSGSTMLADMLMQLGTCGNPREHLRKGMVTLAGETPFDLAALARAVISADTTPNGVFGTKLISHFLFGAFGLHEKGRLDPGPEAELPWRVIRLRRRDSLAQALSTHLAVESTVFFERNRQKKTQRDAYLRDFEYDFDAIDQRHETLLANEARLDDLLATLTVPVHEVVYEDVLDDATGQLATMMDFIGVDVPGRFSAPRPAMARLDDSLSAPIYDRYRADHVAHHGSEPAG